VIFGIALGAGAPGNQTALYHQASASQVGTAAGLFRTFAYIGSIASSAITGIVFRTSVTDHGLHVIAIILVALGAVVLVMTLVDRQLTTPRLENLTAAAATQGAATQGAAAEGANRAKKEDPEAIREH